MRPGCSRVAWWIAAACGFALYVFVIFCALNTIRLILLIETWPPWRAWPVVVFGWADAPLNMQWLVQSLAAAFGFAALQVIFLLPMRGPSRAPHGHGHSLLLSVLAAGAIGAALVALLIMAIVAFLETVVAVRGISPHPAYRPLFALTLLTSWALWSWLIWIFSRKRDTEGALGGMVKLLFAGTAIEVLCVLPLDIMIRRKTNCYCWSGSYHALYGSVAIVLWLAGPGIIIALLSRRRRPIRADYCPHCGQLKGVTRSDRCPECGAAW